MSSTLVQVQMILDTDLHVGQDDSTEYTDSVVVCPLNKKIKSKSDMTGKSRQFRDPARVQLEVRSVIPHLHHGL